MENGGDEDQAIAGLLHDVIEDADPPSSVPQIRKAILEQFGPRVLGLVEGCTDGEAPRAVRMPNGVKEKKPISITYNTSQQNCYSSHAVTSFTTLELYLQT